MVDGGFGDGVVARKVVVAIGDDWERECERERRRPCTEGNRGAP